MFGQKISYRRYFFLLAGFSMMIVLSSIILAVYTIMSTNSSLSLLDRSHDIDKKLQSLISAIREAESGQRGYLLTSKPIFWETFKDARTELGVAYDELQDMLGDDPSQSRNLRELKKAVDERLQMLLDNKSYFDGHNGVDDSLELKILNGRTVMNQVKYEVNQIEQTEESRLGRVREKTFRSSRLSVYIIILTCGLSLLLLISILVVLNREYQAKAAVEKELMSSEFLLQQQVHKLNLSNKELEQFAYVASHDLQEPLRKIISFSEKLQAKLGDHPDEEVTGSLKRLTTSASRMRILISDLLNYSRATKALEGKQVVDLPEVLRQITDDLAVTISGKKAEVRQSNIEAVVGNQTQLQQLFQNLISNALKFNKSEVVRVDIQGERLNAAEIKQRSWGKELLLKHTSYHCILVKDNGIGFEEQYLDQIFVIFQRLHGRSEYEGTGIGLAICKRIVENHEGFITAESSPGKGSTFIVGLPIDIE